MNKMKLLWKRLITITVDIISVMAPTATAACLLLEQG